MFTPDGNRLVSAGEKGLLKIWNAVTGKEVLSIKVDHERIEDFVLSLDGKRLASGSNGSVKLWDSSTGRQLLSLNVGLPDTVPCRLAFSPTSKYLACPSGAHTIKLWELATGQSVLTLRDQPKEEYSRDFICSLAFSPDGRRLAAANARGIVNLWNSASGKALLSLDIQGASVFDMGAADCQVTFSPDGRFLATSAGPYKVSIWEGATGKELRHFSAGSCVAFSPDGRYLAAATPIVATLRLGGNGSKARGELKIWDISNGKEVLCLKTQGGNPYCAAFSPDGKRLALVNQEYTVKVWDVSRLTKEKPAK
jgi:WD40 repeat protein